MKKTSSQNLRELSVVVVAHHSTENGPPQVLRDFFLKKKVRRLLYVGHPLLYLKEQYKKSSFFVLFKNGIKVKAHRGFHWILPEPVLYIKDVFYTILWIFFSRGHYDLFFGADPLNAFSGIFLRFLGRVDFVVYYSIDYTPKRFENSLLNTLYHFVDRISCTFADINWIGTERTNDARVKQGISKTKIRPSIIVPDGAYMRIIERKNWKDINLHTLVYVGFLMQKQGIDLVLDSLPRLQSLFRDIKFIVIGRGPYQSTIKKKISRLKLNHMVEMKGFISDSNTMQTIVASCGIAVAPYVEEKDSYTYYSSAGKPVLYLGCGLPVILTDVPPIARVIQEKRAGLVIRYDRDEFVKAVQFLFESKERYVQYRKNATEFGKTLDWTDLFTLGLKKTLTYVHPKKIR